MEQEKIRELNKFAAEIRLETMKELASFGMGHVGGAMSMTETLAVLYGEVMKVDPSNPQWEDRDFFVLSKGHAGPGLYATLALKGFFPIEKLATLNAGGTMLPSHCSRVHTPGIDVTTGSLGTGISPALGIATAARLMDKDNHVYCMVGDGECDEGQIWEGILFAGHRKLDNFTLIVDNNGAQLDANTEDLCKLGDIKKKLEDFDFYTEEVDGHDVEAIYDALMRIKAHKGQATALVIDTVKGKGNAIAEAVNTPDHMNRCHALPFLDKEANEKEIARLQAIVESF